MTKPENNSKLKSKNRTLTVVGIGYKKLNTQAEKAVRESGRIFASSRLAEVFMRYDEYEAVKDRLQINNSVGATLQEIRALFNDCNNSNDPPNDRSSIVLLASGDPMFYGIGRKVVEEFGDVTVDIIPDISCVQAAFSLIKKPWDDALLISLHGSQCDNTYSNQNLENQNENFTELDAENKPNSSMRQDGNNQCSNISQEGYIAPEVNPNPRKYRLSDIPVLMRSNSKIAILTDPKNNPGRIAGVIHAAQRESHSYLAGEIVNIFVCEHIGYDDERVVSGTTVEIMQAEFADPNVVVIIRDNRANKDYPHKSDERLGSPVQTQKNSLISTMIDRKTIDENVSDLAKQDVLFGLSEDEIAHERGLITKDEVRAVSVHKLELPSAGVLWDIGAGSGSVSLEAARLSPDLRVMAIEKKTERVETIKENRTKYGLNNIDVICGEAPSILFNLPNPDRVFIGGSSGNLADAIEYVAAKTLACVIVINAVTLDTLSDAIDALESHSFEANIVEISVSKMKMLGGKRFLSAENPVFVIKGKRNAFEVKR
jgi:precorrin-6Y C5,15-methyltransferase (decarboxylating)